MSTATVDRSTFLGGSDVAAILGLSPWTTPYALWLEKTGQITTTPSAKQEAVFARGKRLEPYIREWARDDFGLEISAKNERYFHPDYPFLSCEIDFEYQDEGRVANADIKTVHPAKSKDWGEVGTDEIPVYYTTQFLFGQGVTSRDLTLCIAAIGFGDLRPYRTHRDEDLIKHITDHAVHFWEHHVEKRIAPPMTTLEDAKLAYAKDDGSKVEATAEIGEMLAELKLRKAALGGDEARCDLLELQIKKFMQEHTELVGSDGKKVASWKFQERKSFTVQASSSRVFRLFGGNNE